MQRRSTTSPEKVEKVRFKFSKVPFVAEPTIEKPITDEPVTPKPKPAMKYGTPHFKNATLGEKWLDAYKEATKDFLDWSKKTENLTPDEATTRKKYTKTIRQAEVEIEGLRITEPIAKVLRQIEEEDRIQAEVDAQLRRELQEELVRKGVGDL